MRRIFFILTTLALLLAACAPAATATEEVPIKYFIQSIRCENDRGSTDYTVVSNNQDSVLDCGEPSQQPHATLDDGTVIYFWLFSLEDGVPRYYTATNDRGENYDCEGGWQEDKLTRTGTAGKEMDYAHMHCESDADGVRVLSQYHPSPGPEDVGLTYLGHMFLNMTCDTGKEIVEFDGFIHSADSALHISDQSGEIITNVTVAENDEYRVGQYVFRTQVIPIGDGWDANQYLDVWADPGALNCLADYMQPDYGPPTDAPTPVPCNGCQQARLRNDCEQTVGYFQLMPEAWPSRC